jgi:hypothetical protein
MSSGGVPGSVPHLVTVALPTVDQRGRPARCRHAGVAASAGRAEAKVKYLMICRPRE